MHEMHDRENRMSVLNKSPAYSIHTALMAFVLVPFLFVLVFTGWYGLSNLEAQVISRMREDIELIARAVQLPLTEALERDRSERLERTLDSVFGFDRVYGVYVYDRSGRRIASSGTRKAEVPSERAAGLAAGGDQQGEGEFDQAGGEAVFSYFLPLTDNSDRIQGLLQITRRGSDFASYIQEIRERGLAALAVLVVLSIILVYWGYHNAIGRYLGRIQENMRRIGRGNVDHRIETGGPRELRFLTEGINSMLDSIMRSEREVKQQRETAFELKMRLHQSEKLAAIGRFAAGVAHELGAPLSVADGKAQQALRKAGHEAGPVLKEIRSELHRIDQTVRQLMEFARPVRPAHRTVTLGYLVEAALSQVEAERERSAVRIDRPDADQMLMLYGDPLRLEQALVNLLRNAIQAVPGGRVRLDTRVEDGRIYLAVEDDGPGIDDAVGRRLFEPFFTTKASGQGTGLGLAVVEAVVDEHDGQVRVARSELGGARFELSFPVRSAGQAEAP